MSLQLRQKILIVRCAEAMQGILGPKEESLFYDHVELANDFYHFGGRLNVSGKSEAMLTEKSKN